jgi:hypothetical protein
LKRAFVLFLWGPPVVYDRQSNVPDLGALAQRAGVKHLMLAHLGPSVALPGISWSEQIWPPSVSRRNERR